MNNVEFQTQIQLIARQLYKFRVALFLLLIALVYGFVVWRIDTLKNTPPASSAIASKLPSTTSIDQSTIDKVKQLQDNSVSVRALFNQARHNPFKE